MNNSLRAIMLTCTSLTSMLGTVSYAEEASTTNTQVGLEEIMITAQRRATSLQTTAAAISALSATQMKARSIDDVEDLGQFNPGMDVAIYQGEAQIYIRGIGYSGIIGGTDSSTALHLDGVYLSRSSAAVPAFFDVDRVEVVRGPQGTLYGRNATAGSVNIISKKPTDEFSAEVSALYGNYNRYKLFGAVSGPVSDTVKVRLAAQMEDHDGYTTLIRPNSDPLGLGDVMGEAEGKDDFMARLTVQIDPSEDLTITLTGDYYKADDTGSVWIYQNRGYATNPFFQQYMADRGGVLPEEKSRIFVSDLEHFNKPEIWGLTGKIEWALGDYALTSLTAYKKTNPLNRNDLDSTGAFGVDQLREEDHSQFSQEFQISSPGGEKLEWILGLYYFSEENDVRNEYFLPFADEQFGLPSDDECCLLKLNGSSKTKAVAAFGEATYDMTDTLELVLGARYSWEERSGINAVELASFPSDALNNFAALDDASWTSFTPKFGLNYTVSDEVYLYTTVSKGFKSGGYNVGSYQNTPFDPESIWSYEIGVKADLFDDRLRLNSALFYYDYSNLQIQDVEGNNTIVRNAASAEIKGIEIEGTGFLSDNLQLDFGFAWLDSKFTELNIIDPKRPTLGELDLEGNALPRAPKFKFNVGLQYTVPLESGASIMIRGDYAWQDETFFSAFNVPELYQDSYSWGKARVTYTNPDDTWDISAFVDNISDEVVAKNATFNGDIIDSTASGNLAPPRTYGVEVSFRF
ncbi:TonB-dependent receptor [Kordiimonas pumila]|uniref:TonB-dependent receptor n=1 Tax=Kordiimonas pumila TaxID=2161677 RepID=A0ABV7D809_9PROT|nr:TonB-dependent receptor [Kordiimonas pumila]